MEFWSAGSKDASSFVFSDGATNASCSWTLPPIDCIMINIDGAFLSPSGVGIGVIFRETHSVFSKWIL